MSSGLSNRYLWGEVALAAVFGSVLLASLLLSPSDQAVRLFGYEIPIVCGFRRMTGVGCPGCGLTRSFAFMAHLDPVGAFRMNWLGPILFTGFATQPPYRTFVIARELLRRRRARLSMGDV